MLESGSATASASSLSTHGCIPSGPFKNTFLKSETNKQLFLQLIHLGPLLPTFLNALYLELNVMGLGGEGEGK